MADLDILSAQHSDIRLEQQKQAFDLARQSGSETSEIIKEGMKGDHEVFAAVRDNRYDLSSRIENAADRNERGVSALADRFFTVARDTADLRAQLIQSIDTTKLATELNALKSIIESQKNTVYISDKVGAEGEKTRALIENIRGDDLNRRLIERNAEIVEERHHARGWRDRADQSQFATLQTQLQAFGSQLQETRQGMVNFGTMAGVGQTSSSNNV